MSTQLLPQPRANALFSSWTGHPLVSRLESTTSHLLLFPEVILPPWSVLCAWCPTPLQLPKLYLALITSLTSCMQSAPSSTGTSAREWKRENLPRLVRILLLLRKTTRRLVLTRLTKRKKKSINSQPPRHHRLRNLHVCMQPSATKTTF